LVSGVTHESAKNVPHYELFPMEKRQKVYWTTLWH